MCPRQGEYLLEEEREVKRGNSRGEEKKGCGKFELEKRYLRGPIVFPCGTSPNSINYEIYIFFKVNGVSILLALNIRLK